jgi:hypothetical protein
LEKLAAIHNRPASDFDVMGKPRKTSGRYLQVMSHVIPSIYLRSKHARACPDCVRENGYVEAFWELKHSVACPTHRRIALSNCPSCHKTMDWWRKGLTTCGCGHDFSRWQGDQIEDTGVLTILEIMRAKLMDAPLDDGKLKELGFPILAIHEMSLTTLLGIIGRLENFSNLGPNDTSNMELLGLKATAEVMTMWPRGFHSYLERVHAPNANMRLKGLRSQFEAFYEAFFKKGLPRQEVEFLHKAFVDFGEQHWKKAAIYPRLVSGGRANIVGIEGLSKFIGKHPSTTRKLIAKGLIPIHALHQNGHKLFDLSRQMSFEFAEDRISSLRF